MNQNSNSTKILQAISLINEMLGDIYTENQ